MALVPARGWAFVNVALSGNMATAPRFTYDDPPVLSHGARAAKLKAGPQDRAKILLKAGGADLPDGLLPIEVPVVAQLVRADTMGCWTATYETAGTTGDTEFKATAP